MSRWAISDIHGCANTFKYLMEEKVQLKKSDELFILGDYIDRGPDSKGVVDYIFNLEEDGYNVRTLMGNHEDMLLASVDDPSRFSNWMYNGGDTTLRSYGAETIDEIPDKHLQFYKDLEYYIELDDYYLVHAGFNFQKKDPLEDNHAMLWIRGFAPDMTFLGDKRIVHGHTPTPLDEIEAKINDGGATINIDGGCVYKDRKFYAKLVALNLDTLELVWTNNRES